MPTHHHLYPLKFDPILKEKIWGGQKIPQALGLTADPNTTIGEYFCISGLLDDNSVVANGELKGWSLTQLIESYGAQLVGATLNTQLPCVFPLLIKVIDAADDLSVQVHPNDTLAQEKHQACGKTEMWYVLESSEGASLISGFNHPTSQDEFIKKMQEGTFADLLKVNKTSVGDFYYIPAGRIHSIGKGNLIIEIQQTSDITYRVYDFERKDQHGNKRQLHLEEALEAIDFNDAESGKITPKVLDGQKSEVVNCNYFTTNLISMNRSLSLNYTSINSFVILVNIADTCIISSGNHTLELRKMEAALIPSCLNNINITTPENTQLLEVFVNK